MEVRQPPWLEIAKFWRNVELYQLGDGEESHVTNNPKSGVKLTGRGTLWASGIGVDFTQQDGIKDAFAALKQLLTVGNAVLLALDLAHRKITR